jgi:outer membrane protein TolC
LKTVLVSLLTAIFLITATNAEVKKIDFQQAWELAQQYNKSLQTLREQDKYAKLQVKEAYSYAYPVVTATGSYSRYLLIPEIRNDFTMNGEKMTFQMALGRENNFYGGVSLQQPLWIAGKIGIGVKVAKIYRQITEYGLAQGEADLRLQVTQAFYGALLAKEYHQLTRDTEKQISAHVQNVTAMFEQGVVSEYDKLRAEVELSNFHPQVTSAEDANKIAMEAVRIVLGLKPEEEFELVGEMKDIEPSQVDLNQSISEALQKRNDLKQLGLQGEMLKSVLKVEKRNQYWPSFYLSVNYQQQAQENNFEFDKYFWGEGLSAGISVVIPLFDGFKTHSRVQMAKVELKKFELTRGQVEDGIRMEVKTSAWKLNEAWDKLQASRKSVEQAEKGYAIAEVRYQNGISTQVELLDARLAETQAKISELSARYDLIVAKASLERAKGN